MGPEESLVGKLIYAGRLCRSLRADLLLDLGIYAGQDILLKSLANADGQTMGSIAGDLGVRPPTVTKMVARMEAQGLVQREGSKSDNRRAHVHLTEAGRQLLQRIDEAWAKADLSALDGLKQKDEKRLNKVLDKILVNLDRRDPT
ncbi:MAG: MarR family transcriptional regulator [Nitratireductor sp.]|nr:MarR family transcriptional regulator [Nitratireductor sp.]